MITTTGEIRLYPYGIAIPPALAPKWHLQVGLGCHILRPRFKTSMSDHDIKTHLGLMINGLVQPGLTPRPYGGHIEGSILIEDTEDLDNSIRIYIQKIPDHPLWSIRSDYPGEERYSEGD